MPSPAENRPNPVTGPDACPSCEGAGKLDSLHTYCPACAGTGRRERKDAAPRQGRHG